MHRDAGWEVRQQIVLTIVAAAMVRPIDKVWYKLHRIGTEISQDKTPHLVTSRPHPPPSPYRKSPEQVPPCVLALNQLEYSLL